MKPYREVKAESAASNHLFRPIPARPTPASQSHLSEPGKILAKSELTNEDWGNIYNMIVLQHRHAQPDLSDKNIDAIKAFYYMPLYQCLNEHTNTDIQKDTNYIFLNIIAEIGVEESLSLYDFYLLLRKEYSIVDNICRDYLSPLHGTWVVEHATNKVQACQLQPQALYNSLLDIVICFALNFFLDDSSPIENINFNALYQIDLVQILSTYSDPYIRDKANEIISLLRDSYKIKGDTISLHDLYHQLTICDPFYDKLLIMHLFANGKLCLNAPSPNKTMIMNAQEAQTFYRLLVLTMVGKLYKKQLTKGSDKNNFTEIYKLNLISSLKMNPRACIRHDLINQLKRQLRSQIPTIDTMTLGDFYHWINVRFNIIDPFIDPPTNKMPTHTNRLDDEKKYGNEPTIVIPKKILDSLLQEDKMVQAFSIAKARRQKLVARAGLKALPKVRSYQQDISTSIPQKLIEDFSSFELRFWGMRNSFHKKINQQQKATINIDALRTFRPIQP